LAATAKRAALLGLLYNEDALFGQDIAVFEAEAEREQDRRAGERERHTDGHANWKRESDG
jgi:hypothetical protein